MIGSHPAGMVHVTVCARVALERTTSVSVGRMGGGVGDGMGDANSTANVVGMGDGVGGNSGADDSANEREMPPTTNKREITPMMNPLPNWRRAFIISSPTPISLCRLATIH